MKICLASDHAGFRLKERVREYLLGKKYEVEDMGTYSEEPVSWSEYGAKAARRVSRDPDQTRGVIVCGSGIGMSIVSNKFRGVRAALCHTVSAAEMSRRHNNANVLNMGSRIIDETTALNILETWLNTAFDGKRHQERLNFLHDVVENETFKPNS